MNSEYQTPIQTLTYVWKYQSPPTPTGKYVGTRGNGLSKFFIYLGK